MKNILAIDASTEACSVALLTDNTVSQRFEVAPRRHTELVLPMVEGLLKENRLQLTDLDAIALDQGPGSFTGVRVSAGVAQGLAFAAGLPLIPVSSLAALAHAAYTELAQSHILAVIDARMKEIYWGLYHCGNEHVSLVGQEQVSDVEQLSCSISEKCIAVGTGVSACQPELDGHLHINLDTRESLLYPKAASIALLAAQMNKSRDRIMPDALEPVYLRNNVARVSRKQAGQTKL